MARPRDAETTIIGGGALGCAVAYELAKAGRDVQLIERGDLGSATSGQAAGLVGQVRAHVERTRLAMASVDLFSKLESLTGYTADWRQTGSIRIATTGSREEEFTALASVADSAGLHVEFLSHRALRELCPVIDTSNVRAALWCPTDGYLQPNSLVTAYARGARDLGANLCTNTAVTEILIRDGVVVGVETDAGTVCTDLVINAAGPWAGRIAAAAGVQLPIFPIRHEYYVTRPVSGWHAGLPVLRIPDKRIYVRAELSGILCGGWEPEAMSLDPRQVPANGRIPLTPDWEVLQGFAEGLEAFVAGSSEAGIREVFRGWPTFAPDGRFVVGPVPGLRGFVMSAACNAHGVSGSAGLAQHVVESLEPDPSPYVRSLSPSRFMPPSWSWEDQQRRAQRIYQDYYYGSAVTPAHK